MGKRGPQPLPEEERREREKQQNANYYAKNKQKWKEAYEAKKASDDYVNEKVEHILSTLNEKQLAILADKLQSSSPVAT
jgi:hypothetical protein